uniref:Transmembrane protein 131 n=1 Tax=Cacopsylla melanoneura TaxID=428564 RepID=A0A8D8RXS5_9HEMI
MDPSVKVKLYLNNSYKKSIKIMGIVPVPTTEVMTVDFEPIRVPPDTAEPFHVATLTYNWAAAHRIRKCCGTILIRTQGQGRLMIPFTAKVLEGGLLYDESVTKFKTTEGTQKTRFSPRDFMVSNRYRVPLVITSVTLHQDAAQYFEISNFQPVVMQPKENVTLFTLQFKPNIVLPRNNFPTSLSVQTNVSTVVIRLFCYSGRLTKITQNGDPIDLGLIGSDTRKDTHIAFMNENPVPIFLTTWGTNLTNIALEYLGTERGNASSFLSKFDTFYNLTKSMSVLPGHYAVLRVSVFTSQIGDSDSGAYTGTPRNPGSGEGVQYGSVWLKTDYERATLSLKMTLARGGLDIYPDPVTIRYCFPGKICREPLRIGSRFVAPMAVHSVSPLLSNPHFSFDKKEGAMITPGSPCVIGNLTYYVQELNYLGIHTDDRGEKGGIKWMDTLSLPSNTRDFDMENIKLQSAELKQILNKKINLTLRLETDAVSGFLFRGSVAMTRASVTRDRVIHFPLTQIGNTSYRNITLFNPFEKHALKVQLVLEKHYPYSNTIISEIPESLKPPCNFGDCHFTSPQEFGFEKIHQDSHVLSSPIHSVHKDTPFYELEPGENITVNLAFAPSLSQKSTALLFIRNDKTVLETVLLSGIGALVQFDFANRKPGSATPITFSYERKHVDECENYRIILESKASSSKSFKRRKSPLEHLTIMRSFSARNTGELPIDVFGFTINGLKCQGYGFKVLNCRNFTLTPNSSRKIDISFTPDLSLTKVSRVLTIDTSMAPRASATYTLEVSLSVELLEMCGPLLARPRYEAHIFWTLFLVSSLVFFFVVTSAYLDARHMCETSLVYILQDESLAQPVLDLRKIGSGIGSGCLNKVSPGSMSSTVGSGGTLGYPGSADPPSGGGGSASSSPSDSSSSQSCSSWARFKRVASGMTSGYFQSSATSLSNQPASGSSKTAGSGCVYQSNNKDNNKSSNNNNNNQQTSNNNQKSSSSTSLSSPLYDSYLSNPSKLGAGSGALTSNGVNNLLRKRQVTSSMSSSKRGGSGGVGGEGDTAQGEEGKSGSGSKESCWTTLLTKSHSKSHPSPSPSPPASHNVSPSPATSQNNSPPSVTHTHLNNTSANSSTGSNGNSTSGKASKQSKQSATAAMNVINNHKLLNYIKKTSDNVNAASKRNLIDYVSNPSKSTNNKKFNASKTNNNSKKEVIEQEHKRNVSDTSSIDKSPLDELIMQDSFSSDDGKSSPSSIDNNHKDKDTSILSSDTSSNDSTSPHLILDSTSNKSLHNHLLDSSTTLNKTSGHLLIDSNSINKPSSAPIMDSTTSKKTAKKAAALKTHDVFTNNNIFDAKMMNNGKSSAQQQQQGSKKSGQGVVNTSAVVVGKEKENNKKKASNENKTPLAKSKSSPVSMMTEDKQNNLDRSTAILNNAASPHLSTLLSQDTELKMSNLNNNAHNNLSIPSLFDQNNLPLYASSLLNFMSESQSTTSHSNRLNDSFHELSDSSVGSPPSHPTPCPLGPIGPPVSRSTTGTNQQQTQRNQAASLETDWSHWIPRNTSASGSTFSTPSGSFNKRDTTTSAAGTFNARDTLTSAGGTFNARDTITSAGGTFNVRDSSAGTFNASSGSYNSNANTMSATASTFNANANTMSAGVSTFNAGSGSVGNDMRSSSGTLRGGVGSASGGGGVGSSRGGVGSAEAGGGGNLFAGSRSSGLFWGGSGAGGHQTGDVTGVDNGNNGYDTSASSLTSGGGWNNNLVGRTNSFQQQQQQATGNQFTAADTSYDDPWPTVPSLWEPLFSSSASTPADVPNTLWTGSDVWTPPAPMSDPPPYWTRGPPPGFPPNLVDTSSPPPPLPVNSTAASAGVTRSITPGSGAQTLGQGQDFELFHSSLSHIWNPQGDIWKHFPSSNNE